MKRVLVANRGEIAVRVVRACVDNGLESVVAVSEADRDSRAALIADDAICIGAAPPAESYLDVGRVVAGALASGCDAIHPGYGFLSERPELAEACEENGLAFVGPPAEAIRRGGDKAAARAAAESLGIPVGKGSDVVAGAEEAREIAEAIGYPVLLKAAAGGGGRGMVQVEDGERIEAAFAAAQREAEGAFGDGRLFVERFITRARHVEVQVLADRHGNLVHLGERDCSVQRRYQKLIEEAPASWMPPATRDALCDGALALMAELGYAGAGTVEFIVDAETMEYAFLEVNTRVQVEHPVTELLTGVDIVRAQLEIAAGAPLPFTQGDVRMSGHAIEARINCEDASRDFAPVPGRLDRWVEPVGSDLRIDTHCFGGYVVPPYYDSMLAKVIASGADRDAAIAGLERALAKLVVEGVPTTTAVARRILAHPDFRQDTHHTRWIAGLSAADLAGEEETR